MEIESCDMGPLTRLLKMTLPDARAEVRPLDLCPAVKLHLISPENMGRRFTPDEVRSILKRTPYWAFCWAAGHALAALIMENPDICRGMSVLDVGAGSGVAAVAAALAGARQVTACDVDEDALTAVTTNAGLNEVDVAVCRSLSEVSHTPDLILASDVFYDRKNRPLLESLPGLARSVLVADARVQIDEVPPYTKICEMEAVTLPDLGEAEDFTRVGFYIAGENCLPPLKRPSAPA